MKKKRKCYKGETMQKSLIDGLSWKPKVRFFIPSAGMIKCTQHFLQVIKVINPISVTDIHLPFYHNKKGISLQLIPFTIQKPFYIEQNVQK